MIPAAAVVVTTRGFPAPALERQHATVQIVAAGQGAVHPSSLTHSMEMLWMPPGVPPTNKRVEVPLVVIVRFRDGKLAHEHICWDQAS